MVSLKAMMSDYENTIAIVRHKAVITTETVFFSCQLTKQFMCTYDCVAQDYFGGVEEDLFPLV